METIVLTDDELKRLETRFGPVVRQMGPSALVERIVAAYRDFPSWSHPPLLMSAKRPL
jgi:hypothetical protein